VLRPILIIALLLLATCDNAAGPILQENVQPAIAPATLQQVPIAPPVVDRTVVTLVNLGDPTALAATQTDVYKQSPGVADILWVVDTTGSMADERLSLASNFQHFVDALVAAKTDFQIGVTTTDMSSSGAQGKLVAHPTSSGAKVTLITNLTPNPQEVFIANTTFPSSRKRWAQPFRAMATALQDGVNPGFIRKNAALAVIALSDADDESFGGVAYYARLLRSAKGRGWENFTSFSAIAGTLPDGCYSPGEETFFGSKADPPVRLADMVRRTGGVLASICDPHFDQSLTRVAEALNTLKRIFPLTLKPDPATIAVLIDGAPIKQDAANGWQYRPEINSIEFAGDYVPPPGATISIFYAILKP